MSYSIGDDMEDVAGEDSTNRSANSSQQRTANESAAVRSVANHSEVSDWQSLMSVCSPVDTKSMM